MKTNFKTRLLLSTVLLLLSQNVAFAQNTMSDRVKENAKNKTINRGEQKVDNAVENTLNKVEDGVKNLFKKKDKKKKKESAESAENSENTAGVKTSTGKAPVKGNSKFDFVPGEKVLYFDNFERLAQGDFPAEFNTNSSGEIVTIDEQSGKWLSMTKNGAFIPENIKKLPENFTLEFELGINTDPTNNYAGFGLNFTTQNEELMKDMFFSKGGSIVYLHPGAAEASIWVNPLNGSEVSNSVKLPQWDVKEGYNFVKISVWRQKGRLRVYANEDKIFDVPRFFTETKAYDFAFFRSFFDACEVYVTNIRFAVAGSDNRSKLITEGKFVTTGIRFDVNSDNIRPESGAILKEIATALQENSGVRIKIIGHTDSDGNDAANLALSKKRAAAVKAALINFYGIDANRMETDGKGESAPLNKNATPTEKEQNRRVEFIKL